jgi:hypothetical protein
MKGVRKVMMKIGILLITAAFIVPKHFAILRLRAKLIDAMKRLRPVINPISAGPTPNLR